MAKQLGARKCSKQKVIFLAPTVNKTGPQNIPVPYPIVYALDSSHTTSSNVFFNGNEAFTIKSDSNKVTGDEVGTGKGIKSNTVSDKSEPIDSSPSVKINGKKVIRCGDKFNMNSGNTMGTLICSPPPMAPAIKDNGKIEDE